ncbi:hypothetical protein ACG2F4_06010 [Halalkalibaculum sp. DA3122]|uniref:hypothetical protein n=1 Tax=unclassified Halalkalibaculum TaxID=2964617 RepID=UPI0037545C37
MIKNNYLALGIFLVTVMVLYSCDSVTNTDQLAGETKQQSAGLILEKGQHAGSNSSASLVVVTPDNLMGWQELNVRGDGESIISDAVADQHGGMASLQQSFSDSEGKTDFRLVQAFGPVENLNALSFDWYRDGSSTAPDHLTPAIGIFVDDGNGNSWLLKWEGVYNGYPTTGPPAPTDQWITENLLNGNFWRIPQYVNGEWVGFSGCNEAGDPYGCFQFDRSLTDEWLDGYSVEGIEAGIGSGWNGSFKGHVDYITINDTIFDFEIAVNPETRQECMKGGWEEFGFKNQGQCIRYVNTGKDSR